MHDLSRRFHGGVEDEWWNLKGEEGFWYIRDRWHSHPHDTTYFYRVPVSYFIISSYFSRERIIGNWTFVTHQIKMRNTIKLQSVSYFVILSMHITCMFRVYTYNYYYTQVICADKIKYKIKIWPYHFSIAWNIIVYRVSSTLNYNVGHCIN